MRKPRAVAAPMPALPDPAIEALSRLLMETHSAAVQRTVQIVALERRIAELEAAPTAKAG